MKSWTFTSWTSGGCRGDSVLSDCLVKQTPNTYLCHSTSRVFMFRIVRDFLFCIYLIVSTFQLPTYQDWKSINQSHSHLTNTLELPVTQTADCNLMCLIEPSYFEAKWVVINMKQDAQSCINHAWHFPHQGLLPLHYLRFCTQIKAAVTRVQVIFLFALPPPTPPFHCISDSLMYHDSIHFSNGAASQRLNTVPGDIPHVAW